MNPLDSPCATISELITEYLEGALPQAQTVSFETHLVYCSACQLFLGQIRETILSLRGLPVDPFPPEERRLLIAQVRNLK